MFSIKLVGELHPEFSFFGREGKPALMNFPDTPEGRRMAASIPIGHRSLVYLMSPVKRFWAAVEYIRCDPNSADVLEDGRRAAERQNAVALMEVHNPKFAKVWRCIKHLACIDDFKKAPTPDFGFRQGDILRDLEQREYLELFNAIHWSWRTEGGG
jgi:hypothetical protein